MYYVYLIQNENGEIYIGFTEDLKQRLSQHNNSDNYSTRGRNWELAYYEAYCSKEDALERERKLKHHGQSKRWLKKRIQRSLNP